MNTKDLTKGNILKGIIIFAIPVFLGNILQQFYNLTDTWVVGKYLENGLSAIGSCSGIYELILAFANGMTLGFSIVIAREFGSKNEIKKRKSIAYTISLTVIITLLLTFFSVIFMRPILKALNTPEEIFELSYQYIIIITLGMITAMLYNMFTAMMRSAGNSMIALICLIVAVILNIGLDLLFVVVFKLGIVGVAVATVTAQGLAALFCLLFIIFKMPELHISIKDFKLEKKLLVEMLVTGLSMGFMLSIVSLGSLIQQGAINDLGENVITAHSLARKVEFVFMTPLSTMATAASTFTGQNYGAMKLNRVKKGILWNFVLGFIWSAFSILIIYTLGNQVLMLLGSLKESDVEILNPAILHMRINIPFYPVLAILLIMRTSMQSLGYKIIPSLSSAIEMTVKVLIAYLFTNLWGYTAVCVGEPVIWTLCAVTLCVTMCVTKLGRRVLFSKDDDEYIYDEENEDYKIK